MKHRYFIHSIVLFLFFTNLIYGQNVPVIVQAESGIMGSDFRIVDTLGARSVTVKTNLVNTLNPGNNDRVITYQVTFPDSGTYDLYARILFGKNTFVDDSYFYDNGLGTKNAMTNTD